MRILIADKLAAFVAGRLERLEAEVVVKPELEGEALTRALEALDPTVLVVRSTRVSGEDVRAAPRMGLIIRAGAGVNTIDLEAASHQGIYVSNCPGRNAAAVAELALGHLINLDRRIADGVQALREGRWDKKGLAPARGLRGRRIAVLGVGRIGETFIGLVQALGMQVVAWSRSLDDARAEALGVERAKTPEEAVAGADAVSVHLALGEGTRGRIGQGVFEAMKPGAFFVNTSRAEVVDEAALLEAIASKGLRAGLDVFAAEPAGGRGEFTGPIGRNPAVYGTHHVGASTDQAEEAVGEEVVRIIEAFASGAPIPNCVNLAGSTSATHVLVVRHQDTVGVLAGILDVLREAGHNVEEMQNTVFSGSRSAVARIAVVGEPAPATLVRISGDPAVFAATLSRKDGGA